MVKKISDTSDQPSEYIRDNNQLAVVAFSDSQQLYVVVKEIERLFLVGNGYFYELKSFEEGFDQQKNYSDPCAEISSNLFGDGWVEMIEDIWYRHFQKMIEKAVKFTA